MGNCLVKRETKEPGTEALPESDDVLGPRILHSAGNPIVEFAASLSLSMVEDR